MEQAKTLVAEISRKLLDLADRAQQLVDAGRVEELQSNASEMGRQLMLLSYYELDDIGLENNTALQELGLKMRLVETIRLYMDGGVSMQRVVDEVANCSTELSRIVHKLN